MTVPFHLAFPVADLEETERFYSGVLGFPVGRRAEKWIDFDMGGNQISAHLRPEEVGTVRTNSVDGDAVPVRHFGLVLAWKDWHSLAARLQDSDTSFVIEPKVRFEGEVGEQATLFILDPSGNALEFKSFKDLGQLFAH